jgi:hypothetical protein
MSLAPVLAFALFWLVDALARWRVLPARTVSEWVWALGWPGRIGAGLCLAVVFGHLVFQVPDGPGRW